MLPNRKAFSRQSTNTLPSTSVAPCRSFCPNRMEDMVAPPTPTNVQNAMMRFINGKEMAKPDMASAPTP